MEKIPSFQQPNYFILLFQKTPAAIGWCFVFKSKSAMQGDQQTVSLSTKYSIYQIEILHSA